MMNYYDIVVLRQLLHHLMSIKIHALFKVYIPFVSHHQNYSLFFVLIR